MKRNWIIVVLLLIATISFFVYRINKYAEQSKRTKVKEIKSAASIVVKVLEVKPGKIQETLYFTGAIYSMNEVKVFSKVPGKLIAKLKLEGEYVKQDEVFAKIDRDEPGMDYSIVEVKSPITGIITKYYSNIGDQIASAMGMGSMPLAVVADISKVKIAVYVAEDEITKIVIGQSAMVNVDAYKTQTFWGSVTEIAPLVDTMTRKFKVDITVENPDLKLRIGMQSRVNIVLRGRSGNIVVPEIAVIERDQQQVVFIVKDNIAHKTPVVTGIKSSGNIEIVKGISPGDKVVIEGNYILDDKSKVDLIK